METKLIAALLVAVSASLAAPAFASGYGPAPFYRASAGAPVSQRGQSSQAVAAEHNDATGTSVSATSYGGVVGVSSESGSRQLASSTRSLYEGH
jgi:hypothetical protein